MDEDTLLAASKKRRIFLALLCLVIGLSVIMGRLFWIQAVSARSYSGQGIDLVRNSVLQRQRALVLDSGRGQFYDRNLEPLTGKHIKALVGFPIKGEYQGSDSELTRLSSILGISRAAWSKFTSQLTEPRLWSVHGEEKPSPLTPDQVRSIRELNLSNVKVIDYVDRYPANMIAQQLIGFIGQNPERIASAFGTELESGQLRLTSEIGGAGLEKSFEPWLQGIGETSLSFFTDGAQRPLSGLDARLFSPDNGYYPLKVMTTLDLSLQRNIEALMDRLHIHQGAAVVLDASQADILAMASRPSFDPEHVDPEQSNWRNQAVKAIPPGSIMKTVVAAAALEEGVVTDEETFDCKGALGKYGFTCWKKHGHGSLTLEEAFAESCNIAFAKVMQRLNSEQLESYARKLGLLTQVGWSGAAGAQHFMRQLDGEEAGQLFALTTPREDEGVLMQTAIGQRDALVSPLQAANLIVTLLHGGVVHEPRVVQEVRYRTDRVMDRFPEKKLITKGEGISASTSRKLIKWMRAVVEEGTGTELQGAQWLLAGKSGTAQVNTGKHETVNQWFIGYGPAEDPQYAVSVVIENVDAEAANQVIPLFKGIMDLLAEQENKEKVH